jgi:hypothetical protein
LRGHGEILQNSEMNKINDAKGVAVWVNESCIEDVTRLLDTIDYLQQISQKEL